MGCCDCIGAGEKKEKVKSNPLRFKRLCTDLICMVIFALFLGLIMFILGFSIYTGDLNSLFYDADYLGDRCGVGKHSARKKAFYPRIPLDMAAQPDIVASGKFWDLELYTLCVSECPTGFDINSPTFIADYGYDRKSAVTQSLGSGTQEQWISATPTLDILNRCIPRTEFAENDNVACAYPNCTAPEVTALVGFGKCIGSGIPELASGWRVCESGSSNCEAQQAVCRVEGRKIDAVEYKIYASDESGKAMLASVSSLVGGFFEIASELYESWVYLLALGILAPIVMAFLYMVLLFLFAKTIIYGMLFLLVCFMFTATAICFAKSGLNISGLTAESILSQATSRFNLTVPDAAINTLAVTDEETTWIYTVAFWIMLILTIITIVSLALARRKIRICAALVKESTSVFKYMPFMMIFPTITTAFQVMLCAYLLFGLCLLTTIKAESIDVALGLMPNSTLATMWSENVAIPSVDPVAGLRSLHENGNLVFAFAIIHLFGFYVLTQFVTGVGWTTMSGATGWWYYFKDGTEAQTRIPITRSFGIQLVFHSGSIAFQAFILAIFDMLRWVCWYIEKSLGPMAKKNPLGRMLFKCVDCCISCIKRTVEFITFYGLVFVAVNGSSFCKGCFETFSLFTSNLGQVSVNATCVWLLKLLAIGTCPALCGIITLYAVEGIVKTAMYPAMLVFGLAIVMMYSCMQVFECVITTVFVCSFEDRSEYDGKYIVKHPQLAKVFGQAAELGKDSLAKDDAVKVSSSSASNADVTA